MLTPATLFRRRPAVERGTLSDAAPFGPAPEPQQPLTQLASPSNAMVRPLSGT